MMSKFFSRAFLTTAVMLPVALVACGSDNPISSAQGALCCTEFKAGAQLDASFQGSAQSKVAVQAVADIAGIAGAAIDDLTTACRSIATDLDTAPADLDAAEAIPDKKDRMNKYCSLAVTAIGTVKAAAQASITITPPGCSASIQAKASCQGGCSGTAKCDLKANPPTCTGGTLEVSCKGDCTATAQAPTIQCEGSCGGGCTGSCTASGGVKCAGKCDGTCEGNTADGSAKGECQGTCKGTCSATPPEVDCQGSCGGSCKGTCKATPGNATVKCDATCSGEATPLKCNGGDLSGGCKVDAKCEANCNASVKAKAECHPGGIDFKFTGDAQAAGKLKATLDANFDVIAEFQVRLKAVVEATGSFTGNISAVADIKASCILAVGAAAVSAVDQIGAAATASASVAGSLN